MQKRTPAAQMRLNLRAWPALIGLLVVLQLIFPSRAWAVALAMLGGAWAISFLWARSLARNLQLTREMRFGWAQVGDRLQERFMLVNRGWAPGLWVEVVDHSTIPGYQASQATSVGYLDTVRWRTDSVCTRRGLYTLGPTSLHTGDPLGLYTVRLHYPETAFLMVMPPIVPLPGIEIAPGGRAGEGRRQRAGALERTVSGAGAREYHPDDSPKWIHWPMTAHHDALFVRLFDSTPASDWWIFLDLEQRVQVGQGWDSTEEHGVLLAASLADRGLRAGHAVGLVAHGQDLVWLPPQCAQGQRIEILRALALATAGDHPLGDLLARARPAFRRGASLVVITPAVDGEWIAPLLPLLKGSVAPTVLLLDPASFGGVGDVGRVQALLADLGVVPYVVTPDLLDRPEARPGTRGQWEWRFLPDGRAIPVRQPGDLRWRRMA